MTTITRFTKEQLIEIAQENVDVWQLAMDTDSGRQKEYAAIRLRVAEIALALLEAEQRRNPVLAYADSYRDMAKQGVESIPVWSVITDLERNIAPLYTAPPAPVVPTFEEWLEIRGNKPIGWVKDAMRESYDACRAAMLQGSQPVSNRDELSSPVIPDGYALVPKEPTEAMLLLLGLTGSFTAMDAAYQKMLAASPLHSATSTDI